MYGGDSHQSYGKPCTLALSNRSLIGSEQEVAKTRLQLDGELQQKAKAGPAAEPVRQKVYSGPVNALAKTYKFEGIRGVQRGLGAAYTYQILLQVVLSHQIRRI